MNTSDCGGKFFLARLACGLSQDPPVSRSLVVPLVCVMCLLCYAVAAAVLRKLDQLDLRRASVVPLCGKDGVYKYEIQVKTGWTRGAGEGGRG